MLINFTEGNMILTIVRVLWIAFLLWVVCYMCDFRPWRWFNRQKFLSLLILLIFLSGCSSTMDIKRDSEGRIYEVELKGPQETEVITKDGETVKGKTTINIWPKDLITVLK